MEHMHQGMRRELLRKLLHVSVLAVLPLLDHAVWAAFLLLCLGGVVYMISEEIRLERISRRRLPVRWFAWGIRRIQLVTVGLSRNHESEDIVWAPVTLAVGALLTMVLFPPAAAAAGILCLAFGDTAALIAGRIIKGPLFPLSGEKHLSGMIACWAVCSLIVWLRTGNIAAAVLAGAAGSFAESVQMQNIDNIILPLSTAYVLELTIHFTG